MTGTQRVAAGAGGLRSVRRRKAGNVGQDVRSPGEGGRVDSRQQNSHENERWILRCGGAIRGRMCAAHARPPLHWLVGAARVDPDRERRHRILPRVRGAGDFDHRVRSGNQDGASATSADAGRRTAASPLSRNGGGAGERVAVEALCVAEAVGLPAKRRRVPLRRSRGLRAGALRTTHSTLAAFTQRLKPRTKTPRLTSAMPNHSRLLGRSPRKSTAINATRMTLSLSTGATLEASPSLSARK